METTGFPIWIPDLVLDEDSGRPLGKYGRMRQRFLRDYHSGTYTAMLLTGKLNAHLDEIDQNASDMMERLTAQMVQAEGVTETLKASDSDGMGTPDEQYPRPCGRNRIERSGVQLNYGKARLDRYSAGPFSKALQSASISPISA